MNKKIIAPILSIAALAGVSVATTYALFTSNASSKVVINSGTVAVSMESTIDFARSRYEDLPPFDAVENAEGTEFDAVYENGNTAKIGGTTDCVTIDLDRMAPMDDIGIKVNVKNNSNIDIKWRLAIETKGELIPALTIKVDDVDYSTSDTGDRIVYSSWSEPVTPEVTYLMEDVELYVAFPDNGELDNQYQNKLGDITISVEAVQGNATVEDPHNDEYGFFDSYQVDDYWVHEISNVDEFTNIYDSTIHSSKTGALDYPGANDETTVFLLIDNLDFGGEAPFGDYEDDWYAYSLKGIFDGGDKEISNFAFTSTTTSKTDAVGLFSTYKENAQVKNFTLKNCVMDGAFEKAGLVLGHGAASSPVTGEVVIENIIIDASCEVNSSIKSVAAVVGSLRNNRDVTVRNVTNNANVYADSTNVGGIGGTCSTSAGKLTVINCVNNGNISGSSFVGGLFGGCQNFGSFEIKNNTLNGNVNASASGAVTGFFVAQYTSGKTPVAEENVVNGYIFMNGSTNCQEKGFSGYVTTDGSTLEDHIIAGTVGNLSVDFDEQNSMIVDAYAGASYYKVTFAVVRHSGVIENGVVTTNSVGNYTLPLNTQYDSVESLKGVKKLSRIGYVLPDGYTFDITGPMSPAYIANGRYNFYRLSSFDKVNETFEIAEDNAWGLVMSNYSASKAEVFNPIGTNVFYYVSAYDSSDAIIATGVKSFAVGSGTTLKNIAGVVFDHNAQY